MSNPTPPTPSASPTTPAGPIRSTRLPINTAEKLQVAGLLIAGLGVLTLYLSGLPGFPPVPPGPIILIGLAAVIAFVRWRWIRALGLLATVGISAGFLATIAGAMDRLADPGRIGYFAGTAAQLSGLVIALIAGVTALVIRSRRPARS